MGGWSKLLLRPTSGEPAVEQVQTSPPITPSNQLWLQANEATVGAGTKEEYVASGFPECACWVTLTLSETANEPIYDQVSEHQLFQTMKLQHMKKSMKLSLLIHYLFT